MKCPHCGQEHPDNSKFCSQTGKPISKLKACTNPDCPDFGKHILPAEAKFCPRCGKSIEKAKEAEWQTMPRAAKKQSQIVVVCAKDGGCIHIGDIGYFSSHNEKRLSLKKGKNVLQVEQYPELTYGFRFERDDNAENIVHIDLNDYDTSNVTNMRRMFYGCSELKHLDLSGFNVSNVYDMSHMFHGCYSLTSLDLNFGCLNKYDSCHYEYMFCNCSSLEVLDLSHLTPSADMNEMFCGCGLLKSIELVIPEFVCSMRNMFHSCHSLETISMKRPERVFIHETMRNMFYDCRSLKSIDLRGFDTSDVKDMSGLFASCSSLESLDIRNFNMSNVMNWDSMFGGCWNLKYIHVCRKSEVLLSNLLEKYGVHPEITHIS